MILRLAINDITKTLNRQAAVALLSPRQAGKTTLALEIAQQRDAVYYLDLEGREDRRHLAEPGMLLDGLEDRLVILDEIHRTPELFQTLRGVIDRGRRRGKGLGRFLVLGSASVDLLRQTGESLAGRIAYLDLGPFSLGAECGRHWRARIGCRIGGAPKPQVVVRRKPTPTALQNIPPQMFRAKIIVEKINGLRETTKSPWAIPFTGLMDGCNRGIVRLR